MCLGTGTYDFADGFSSPCIDCGGTGRVRPDFWSAEYDEPELDDTLKDFERPTQ